MAASLLLQFLEKLRSGAPFIAQLYRAMSGKEG